MTDLLNGMLGRPLPRYIDLLKPAPPEDERTAEEIIDHIKKKLASA